MKFKVDLLPVLNGGFVARVLVAAFSLHVGCGSASNSPSEAIPALFSRGPDEGAAGTLHFSIRSVVTSSGVRFEHAGFLEFKSEDQTVLNLGSEGFVLSAGALGSARFLPSAENPLLYTVNPDGDARLFLPIPYEQANAFAGKRPVLVSSFSTKSESTVEIPRLLTTEASAIATPFTVRRCSSLTAPEEWLQWIGSGNERIPLTVGAEFQSQILDVSPYKFTESDIEKLFSPDVRADINENFGQAVYGPAPVSIVRTHRGFISIDKTKLPIHLETSLVLQGEFIYEHCGF